jgi:hypothetical protein
MDKNKRPGYSEYPGQKPQNDDTDAVRNVPRFNMNDSISTPLSQALRPRPAIFIAFDETALALAQKQLAGFIDVAFWDVRLGPAGMPPHRARFLFELTYNLTFFYPCNPALQDALNRRPRAVALPPMPPDWAAATLGLRCWLNLRWPESSRAVLKTREACHVHN